LTGIDERLYETRYDHAATIVQMNAVRMKLPPILPGDLIGTFSHNENSHRITIKRQIFELPGTLTSVYPVTCRNSFAYARMSP
jgi:hypothetical protein